MAASLVNGKKLLQTMNWSYDCLKAFPFLEFNLFDLIYVAVKMPMNISRLTTLLGNDGKMASECKLFGYLQLAILGLIPYRN